MTTTSCISQPEADLAKSTDHGGMMPRPLSMPVLAENIPNELKRGRQFVVWRWEFVCGRWTKPPYHPSGRHARSNDPDTWVSFEEALAAYKSGEIDGIGRCFVKDDPFTAFDLDKCRGEDGTPSLWAASMMTRLDTYTEITPSGTGYRPWVIAQKPGPRSGRKDPHVEIYDNTSKRYLCLTGHCINGNRVIHPRQEVVDAIYKEIFDTPISEPPNQQPPSKNGPDLFQWNGQINILPVRPEIKDMIRSGREKGKRSEAIMAVLCALIWSGLSDSQICEIFEQFPIGEKYREKGEGRLKWFRPQLEKARAKTPERAKASKSSQGVYNREPSKDREATQATPAAVIDDWQEPMPLTGDRESDPYPVSALPGHIGEAVDEVQAFVQCDPALPAASALTAISTAGAGLIDVRRADKLTGPVGLYFMTIAESGERKDTSDDFFSKAIEIYDLRQEELFKPEIQSWRAADSAWSARRDGIINALRDAEKKGRNTDELQRRLNDLQASKPERPRVPNHIIGDATSEKLLWRLYKEWPVGGIILPEGGTFFGSHSMNAENQMRNLSTINSLWSGASLRVERRTSESFMVAGARLSVGVQVQEGVLRQFDARSNGLAESSGFYARFLISWPKSTQGYRPFKEPPTAWPAIGRFHRRLTELLDLPLRFDEAGRLTPEMLGLSPDSKAAWIKFHDDVERELRPGGELEKCRGTASKAADNCARVAALFHLFENGPIGLISADHITRAAQIVAWHLFEAKRFFGQVSVPNSVRDALLLEDWLIKKIKTEHLKAVPIAEIQQKGPNRTRRKAALESAMRELENCNRVKRMKDAGRGFVRINPTLLT